MGEKRRNNFTNFGKTLRRRGKTAVIIGSAVLALGGGLLAYNRFNQNRHTSFDDIYRTHQKAENKNEAPTVNDVGGGVEQQEKENEAKDTQERMNRQQKRENTGAKRGEGARIETTKKTDVAPETKKEDKQYSAEMVYNDAKTENIKVKVEEEKPAVQQTRAQTHAETGSQGESLGGLEADIKRAEEEQKKEMAQPTKEEKKEVIHVKKEQEQKKDEGQKQLVNDDDILSFD